MIIDHPLTNWGLPVNHSWLTFQVPVVSHIFVNYSAQAGAHQHSVSLHITFSIRDHLCMKWPWVVQKGFQINNAISLCDVIHDFAHKGEPLRTICKLKVFCPYPPSVSHASQCWCPLCILTSQGLLLILLALPWLSEDATMQHNTVWPLQHLYQEGLRPLAWATYSYYLLTLYCNLWPSYVSQSTASSRQICWSQPRGCFDLLPAYMYLQHKGLAAGATVPASHCIVLT